MNKKLIKIFGGIISGILIIPLLNGCSGAIDIQSLSNDNKIVVDGNQQDWGSLSFIKNENIGFGFRNDKDNLYLCVVTSDRMKVRKILSGLTVWLKTNKDEIGIKFPMKPEGDVIPDMKNSSNDEGIRLPDDDSQSGNDQDQKWQQRREQRLKFLISRLQDLQIITPDYLPLYTNKADEGPGFIGKLGYHDGQLVYEIKIPLVNNDITKRIFDNSINEVKINFQTDKIEMPSSNFKGRSEGRGGMEPPEGGGGFGGPGGEGGYGSPPPGGGGREGRQGRRGMGQMDFDALDYAFDVTLSK